MHNRQYCTKQTETNVQPSKTCFYSRAIHSTLSIIINLSDPNSRPPGFDLGRHEWVLQNRFRTTQGRCASLMHRWGYVDSPVSDCGADQQTMSHIVNECPI
jgi:hypothetical protein